MHDDDSRRKSRWTMRVMEWDEPRARYPNLWHRGMPAHLLAFERIGSRLRLGDLIAVYHPASTRHPERSERFVGLARITGVRRADQPGHAWIDLETAHRFDPPFAASRIPRHVFMCCDPGWPEPDVSLFDQVFRAAVAAGFMPSEEERTPDAAPPHAAAPAAVAAPETPDGGERLFAGADYSGDMRDPRQSTWLAVVALRGTGLRVLRLEPTGRSGLQAALRNPDRALMLTEAIGLGFPFGLPLPFAESLLGGAFPAEGWWALARRLERVRWPDYLTALHEFRDARGEIQRLADARADAISPLHRVDPDMGSRCYHGIRMIASDRSRYAIRPFESAQGRLLFEVYPGAALKRLGLPADSAPGILDGLGRARFLPVEIDAAQRRRCIERRDALDAVIAARCAAVAMLTNEAHKKPEELAPDHGEQVRCEGWIYGLEEPA